MIDPSKKYRTRDGREVRIYATDEHGNFPVVGAIKHKEGWVHECWAANGRIYAFAVQIEAPEDLIEVRPRIKRTVWLNVLPLAVQAADTKSIADYFAPLTRLACVKIEIDCEEGEGL